LLARKGEYSKLYNLQFRVNSAPWGGVIHFSNPASKAHHRSFIKHTVWKSFLKPKVHIPVAVSVNSNSRNRGLLPDGMESQSYVCRNKVR
jgi:hypothetical protein